MQPEIYASHVNDLQLFQHLSREAIYIISMSFNKKPKTIDPNEVDPSVYYYDEVYDEMKDEDAKVGAQHQSKDTKKVSKYIEGLKQTAEIRKAEKELRKFKRYASDRRRAEADGDISDEDVYITSAYKKKLDEFKKLEEEKRRQLDLEKDNTMNFLKTQPKSVIEQVQAPTKSDPSRTSDESPIEIQSSSKDRTDKISDGDSFNEGSSKSSKRKRPRTIDERREYLREILAKRTIGTIFNQAVERYHIRKASI